MSYPASSFRTAGRAFQTYYAALVVLNLVLLVLRLPHLTLPAWPLVALWTALYVLALVLRVPIEGGNYVLVSAALDYAGIVVLGAPTVALLNILVTLGYESAIKRPLRQVVFNASLYSLMVLLAGDVYRLLGGTSGGSPVATLLPMLGAGLVYLLVNRVGVSVVVSLFEHIPTRRAWQMNYRWGIVFPTISIGIGVLIAFVYERAGIPGVLLGVLPVLLFWYYFQLYAEIRRDLRSFVRALTSIIEEVDPYTRNHSLRVAHYATQIARAMKLPEREVDTIEFGGLLHDLGKVSSGLSHIVQKPAALTTEERRLMDSHPGTGADIVDSVRALRKAAELVRAHHERPDGKGYPRGLEASAIPLGARIILVADTFDAMTSDRPYRAALRPERAVEELRRYAGSQFDPGVVEVLASLRAAGELELLYEPTAALDGAPAGSAALADGTSAAQADAVPATAPAAALTQPAAVPLVAVGRAS